MADILNPPAFPTGFTDEAGFAQEGMDLRDWFAGHAIGGMLASEAGIQPYPHDWAAERAYLIAEAMLSQRAALRKKCADSVDMAIAAGRGGAA